MLLYLYGHWLPGVYAVVLVTKDAAGNAQVARQFLIFDNVNDISISSAEDKQLLVLSAAENTSHTWLTSLQAGDGVGDQVRRNTTWISLASERGRYRQ